MSPPHRHPRWPPPLRAVLAFLPALGILLAIAGCGKKGPPLPPLKRGPDRVTEVVARQTGRQAVVTGLLPERSEDGSPLRPLQEVRIFRLNRSLALAGGGTRGKAAVRAALRQFTREAKRIATLSGETLGEFLSGRRLTYVDPEPVEGTLPAEGQEVTYAITVVDVEKRSSPLSPFAPIRLLPPPLPPSNLRAEYSEKRIRIQWEPPSSPEGSGEPAYNVYRSQTPGKLEAHPRNGKPLDRPFFEEEAFAFGNTYYYVVRTVAGDKPPLRESEDSVPLTVSPVDVYPPGIPTGVAVSAESGVIKLYWFPNSEPDLGVYRIYRSEQETEGFELIGTVGPSESIHVDTNVLPGVKYYYAITAVDQANPPNESERSEVHGDRLPPAAKQPPARTPPPRRP